LGWARMRRGVEGKSNGVGCVVLGTLMLCEVDLAAKEEPGRDAR
jgi:hypothetical protein